MRGFDVFFDEWRERRPGSRRSLGRAAALLDELGLDPAPCPVLGVVGSKGKGTAATYAAATLAAAGLRTVLVTGPSFRGYRERVRVDGTSVPDTVLAELGERLDAGRRRLPPPGPEYLAPSGLFLMAGLLHARRVGADVCVLEAGMGGRRDELRLIGPDVVALGGVFAEHVGVLGDTVEEIAAEKAAVAGARTEAFVTLPQSPGVDGTVAEAVAAATEGRVVPEQADPRVPGSALLPAGLRPPGLSAASAVLGHAAARRLLSLAGHAPADPARLRRVLGSVRLPARLSLHRLAAGGARRPKSAEVIVDSAIDRTGVAAAVEYAYGRWGRIDHVLLCLPDHKDVAGAVEELGALAVTAVRLPESHLRFTRRLPGHWKAMAARDLSPAAIAGLGDRVLALGTVYFTGRVLEVLDARTDRLFSPA